MILEKAPTVSEKTQIGASTKSPQHSSTNTVEQIKTIRSQKHQSWSNIRKAACALQGLPHEPFGTPDVENSAKSCVRKICAETTLSYAEIEAVLDEQGW